MEAKRNHDDISFEMRLLDKPDSLIVIVKKVGARREWNYYYTEDSLNTVLLRGFVPNLSYEYYNGVSITTINFMKNNLRLVTDGIILQLRQI